MTVSERVLEALQSRIGHRFADIGVLTQALTHSSAVGERSTAPQIGTYERLEFLGDRVLALVIADMLYFAFPLSAEGDLARRLTALVRNETCAEVARVLDLGAAVHLGGGEAHSGGRTKATILGDVCEALIGAIYLDAGMEPARRFIETHWRAQMMSSTAPLRDAKTTLQEWAQGRRLPTPSYKILERSGPEHAPRFVVAANVEGLAPDNGEGGTRREAEQNAAAALLFREGVWRGEGR
jgi:ribonuclease-3